MVYVLDLLTRQTEKNCLEIRSFEKMSNTSYKWVEDSTRQNQSSLDLYSELASADSQQSLTVGHGSSPVGSMRQVVSPRTSKKRNFLHALSKGTSRRGTVITRPMNRDGMTEEWHDVS